MVLTIMHDEREASRAGSRTQGGPGPLGLAGADVPGHHQGLVVSGDAPKSHAPRIYTQLGVVAPRALPSV